VGHDHPTRSGDAAPTTSELVAALQRAIDLVRSHFAVATAGAGVTPVQAKALGALSQPTTVKDLAALLGADVSNTSSTIDRLEALGLVAKEVDRNDRRARLITLTERGTHVRAKLEETAFNTVPAFKSLSAQERTELHRLLVKIGRED
jgi:DNA-binding MarR family transcriptional regulator